MAETRTKAFRADDETIKRVEAWAESEGLRNAEVLPAMLHLIELSQGRESLAGRADEIDNFQNLVNQLTTAYVASLNLATNADERIRAEYAKKLEQQQALIETLQVDTERSRNAALAAIDRKEQAIAQADHERERAAAAEKRNAELENNLVSKDLLNSELNRRVKELEAIIDASKEELDVARENAEALAEAEKVIHHLQGERDQQKAAAANAYEKGKNDGKREAWDYFRAELNKASEERARLIDKLVRTDKIRVVSEQKGQSKHQ